MERGCGGWCAGSLGRATARGRTVVRETTVRRRPCACRTGTNLVVEGTLRAAPASAGEPGCGPLLIRRRDSPRTPPSAAMRENRVGRCTTAARNELGCRRPTVERRRGARESWRSSRQAVAALGATALQDLSASAGAHPLPEAVLLGSATIVGLVGALHANPSLQGGRPDGRRIRPACQTPACYGRDGVDANRATRQPTIFPGCIGRATVLAFVGALLSTSVDNGVDDRRTQDPIQSRRCR